MKLLYLIWVISDPQGGEEDTEAQKIEEVCKEVSRRSGGLVVFCPRCSTDREAYEALCTKFNIQVLDTPTATPKELMQYISSCTLMGLSRSVKDLPHVETEAPCQHINRVQSFDIHVYAGHISKPHEGLEVQFYNLWDKILSFIQKPFPATDPAAMQCYGFEDAMGKQQWGSVTWYQDTH